MLLVWIHTLICTLDAEIFALNTYSKDFTDRAQAMAKAIDWAIEQKLNVLTYSADVISGGPGKILDAALARAHRAGIVTTFIHCAHEGNIMPSGLWPGPESGREPELNVLHYDYSVVIIEEYRKAVAGEKTWYQPCLSVSSTSPVVGGIVAMMKSLRPSLTPAECKKILRETSHPITFEGKTAPRGLEALAALQKVRSLK